jgi:hypothetical protein
MWGDKADTGRWGYAPSTCAVANGLPPASRSPALAPSAAPAMVQGAPPPADPFACLGTGGPHVATGRSHGGAQPPRARPRPAGAVHGRQEEIARTTPRWGVPEEARGVRGDAARAWGDPGGGDDPAALAGAGGIDHHEVQTLRLQRTEALSDGPWAGASRAKSGGVGVALLPSVGDGTRALTKR